jgi:hypothetical protein
MITRISSHKRAATKFHFDNGNIVSIVWGGGTYTDNHDDMSEAWPKGVDLPPHLQKPGMIGPYGEASSTNVEIWAEGHEKFEEWFRNHFGDGDNNPAGYIPVSEIPYILAKADSAVYMPKDMKNA